MTVVGTENDAQAKARGAYYTPPELTEFLTRWAIRSPEDVTFEPSCGDGAFVGAAADRYRRLGVQDLADVLIGVEREPVEAAKARELAPTARILASDFFDLEPAVLPFVDAVIGNPPYIRYHGFSGRDREKGLERARQVGIRLTRLSSSWAPFVVHATSFLAERGRLGLVLPAELLHTEYGQPVRDLLLRRFRSVVVVAFDRPVFGAQVDAILLLASDDDDRGLRVVRVPDAGGLSGLDVASSTESAPMVTSARWSRNLDAKSGVIYTAIEASGAAVPLGTLASVDIGFVSGADDYFVMTLEKAQERGIPSGHLTPAIRRPRDIPGLLASHGRGHLLLYITEHPAPSHSAVRAYLHEGEASGVSRRYKCRVRSPWYAVPLPRSRPDAFLPYMSHHGPRLIVNDVGAWSTNLVHGVRLGLLSPPPRALSVAMASSLTLLSAEIEGRSYGGGVLKLETKEAERVLVPNLDRVMTAALLGLFDETDALVGNGQIEQAASLVDAAVGIDHGRVWGAYQVFRQRRAARGHARRRSTSS